MPTARDTQWMLDVADRHSFVRGVVGWVDMLAADAPQQLAALAQRPKLKGVRPMLQDLADPWWIAQPQLDAAASALSALGLCFDALVRPVHLPALLVFARRHPALRIVIDHGAKPEIASGALQPWARDIAELARLPNVHCKISGLLTEAGERTRVEDLLPYVQALWTAFGPSRLLWGSDWPVLRLAGDYAGWLATTRALLAAVRPAAGADETAAILGTNAATLYRL
jgi:L-fuconolactonase